VWRERANTDEDEDDADTTFGSASDEEKEFDDALDDFVG
jgi:hypothetical protein